jgi:SAM-dependent methyltransferase
MSVLEHVRETGGDEQHSLREIRRVLKPDGVFICCHFPNRRSWIDWVARRRQGQHYHTYRYSKSDITHLMSAAGFEIRDFKWYGALPRNSLGRLPPRFGDSVLAAQVTDRVDDILGWVIRPFVQNAGFVARPVRDRDGPPSAALG